MVQAGLLGKWSVLKLGVVGDVAKSENGLGPEVDIKSMKSPWWKGGVGRKSEALKPSSLGTVTPSSVETGTSVVSCNRGEVAPPIGPSLGSRRERSAASRRGYIRRVK